MAKESEYSVTRNACKLCNPLGACLAFRGIENSVPILHGSQGCSTYIRRYLISHFKEPIDIASSNFSEDTAIFGGSSNLKQSITNIRKQYHPDFIGIASTCLSETIGDDVSMIVKEYIEEDKDISSMPAIVSVATPSYKGTHIDGFHDAVKSLITRLANGKGSGSHITLLPGMLSPADIRHLKEVMADFNLKTITVPDYSDTLDGPLWEEYERISPGGTPVADIIRTGDSSDCVEFSSHRHNTPGEILSTRHNVKLHRIPIPVGVRICDSFFSIISDIAEKEIPEKYIKERGRLIDAYVDSHKHCSGMKAIVYGEEDMVIAMISFLMECGIHPVLCATGSRGNTLDEYVSSLKTTDDFTPLVMQGVDFAEIEDQARKVKADIMIGNSKGYSVAKNLNIPLVRIGFPVHDRIGGGRILHVGYRGTIELFDRIVNSYIEDKQNKSSVGYTYM